jgi:hypothetical protein
MDRALAAKLKSMSARIKPHSRFKGIQIYNSANTHPHSKTTSLLIFTEDLPNGKPGIVRFRYRRHDTQDHTRASCEAARFITDFVKNNAGQLGVTPGIGGKTNYHVRVH